MVKVFKNSRFEGLEKKGKFWVFTIIEKSNLSFNSSSTIQLKIHIRSWVIQLLNKTNYN
jgi:hypothetical protein